MIGSGLFLTLATSAYVLYVRGSVGQPSGGTWPGLIFGILAALAIFFAALLAARKKVPAWRIGRAKTWLMAHIWIGGLTLPLLLFHTGFRWGHGWLTGTLWIVFLLAYFSGWLGLILQHYLPAMMTQRVQMETIYEQIPRVCQVMQEESDELVSDVCGVLGVDSGEAESKKRKRGQSSQPVEGHEPLKVFYLNEVRHFLGPRYLVSARLAKRDQAMDKFEAVRRQVPAALHEVVNTLESFCDERRELALQIYLHHLLHFWLFLHVPLTMALLLLSAAHIVMSLWY